jgi:hypothetical protein
VIIGFTVDAKRKIKHIPHHDFVLNVISFTNLLGLSLFHIQKDIVAITNIDKIIAITH